MSSRPSSSTRDSFRKAMVVTQRNLDLKNQKGKKERRKERRKKGEKGGKEKGRERVSEGGRKEGRQALKPPPLTAKPI